MADRVFGEIEGIPVGTSFATRKEAAASGIHKPLQAGISGSKNIYTTTRSFFKSS